MENTPSLRTAASNPALDRIVMRLALGLALWLAVVALFTAQWYAQDALLSGADPWPLGDYLRWAVLRWSVWIALAPFVFWLAGRYPVDSPLQPRFIALHLAASIAVVACASIVGALASHWFLPDAPTVDDQLRHFAGKHALIDFIAYWVVVAIRQTMHFYREKNRRELESSELAAALAESRLQLLKMQLQPHFLFNTLHTIVTLIDEDPTAAEEMLLRLSELLRAFLDDYQGHEIPLRHELELVELYLGIQRTRFRDRLTTEIRLAPDTLDCAVPSLILQPLVENAIQHGIGRNIGEDNIEIESRLEGDHLCLEVRNRNSVLERISSGLHRRGIGLSNSRLRLREIYGDAAEIHLIALTPRGACCRVRVPIRRLDVDDLVRPAENAA